MLRPKLALSAFAGAALLAAGSAQAITFTPPASIPQGGTGFAHMLDITGMGGIGDQDQARAAILGVGGTRVLAQASVINHVGNGDATPEGHYGNEILLPQGAVDNRAVMIRGRVEIKTTGQYTFNVASDDGFTLAFNNGAKAFTAGSVYGGGTILDTYNGTANGALTFFGGRGTADSGATIFLEQGFYEMDLSFHDGCCGDDVELTYANGSKAGYTNNNEFKLVGGKARVLPGMVGDMNVEVRRGSNVGNGGIAGALAAINGDLGTGFFGTAPVINHKDPEAGVCCGGVDNGLMLTLPGDTGGDDNDYAAQWTGTLNMPTAGEVFFHIQTDDGFQLQIDGATWTGIGGQITSIVGGELNADVYTGNSDVRALADLAAGQHNFKFTLFEGGGGSYATVWMGGDAGTPGAVLLGSIGRDGRIQDPGIQFVSFSQTIPEPASALLGLLAVGAMGLRRRRLA